MNSWLRSWRLLLPAAGSLLQPPRHNILQLHAIGGHLFRRPSTVSRDYYSTSLQRHMTGHLAPCGYSQRALTSRCGMRIAASREFHVETVPYTKRRHVVVGSHHQVREVGNDNFAQFKTENASKIVDPQNHDCVRVREIGSKIIRAIHTSSSKIPRGEPAPSHIIKCLEWVDELNWEMIVMKDDMPRVGCRMGGKIVVSTGFLKQFNTDVEIAVALGHEVGHVIARHTQEVIRFIMLLFNRFPTHLIATPFLRRNEREADYIGMLLLAAAGFDPHAAPIFYEKCANIRRESTLLNMVLFFSCKVHPSFKKTSRLLSQPKVMEEAMELYREATGDYDQG